MRLGSATSNVQPVDRPRRVRRGGGTLIELLIVVAIIGLIMGILIPTVGGARRRTHEVICRSNLKQMQTMWLMYIQQGNGRIPYTRYSSSGFNWLDALNSIQASDTVIWNTEQTSLYACPQIQADHGEDVTYTHNGYAYAINTWWDNDGTTHDQRYNDQKQWSRIVRPAEYAWFVDPQLYPKNPGYGAAHRVPYGSVGAPDWGLGANHGDGTSANVAYADGNVRSVNIQEVRSVTMSVYDWPWFAND